VWFGSLNVGALFVVALLLQHRFHILGASRSLIRTSSISIVRRPHWIAAEQTQDFEETLFIDNKAVIDACTGGGE